MGLSFNDPDSSNKSAATIDASKGVIPFPVNFAQER